MPHRPRMRLPGLRHGLPAMAVLLLSGCPAPMPPMTSAGQPETATTLAISQEVLQGQALDAANAPRANAPVYARLLGAAEALPLQARTDPSGRFELPLAGVAPGSVLLVVAGEGDARLAAIWRHPVASLRSLTAGEPTGVPFSLALDPASTTAYLLMPTRFLAAGFVAALDDVDEARRAEIQAVILQAYDRLYSHLETVSPPSDTLANATWDAGDEGRLPDATLLRLAQGTFASLIQLSHADLSQLIRAARNRPPAGWLERTVLLPPVFADGSSGGSGSGTASPSPSPSSSGEGSLESGISFHGGSVVNDGHPEAINP